MSRFFFGGSDLGGVDGCRGLVTSVRILIVQVDDAKVVKKPELSHGNLSAHNWFAHCRYSIICFRICLELGTVNMESVEVFALHFFCTGDDVYC